MDLYFGYELDIKRNGIEMNEHLLMVLLVMAGGAVGALLRFGVSVLFPVPEGIAWNTLAVNFIGCSLITLLFYSMDFDPMMRALIFVGLFGGFTTMSSVSLETIGLYVSGSWGLAILNFVLNMTACIGGGILGKLASVLL